MILFQLLLGFILFIRYHLVLSESPLDILHYATQIILALDNKNKPPGESLFTIYDLTWPWPYQSVPVSASPSAFVKWPS